MSTYITINDPVVDEASTYVEFVVSLSAASTSPISVNYSSSNATTNYSDLESVYGTLQFAAGVTTQTVRIDITPDTLTETIEAFQLYLSSPVNAVLTRPVGTALLVDNDTLADAAHPATLSVRDVIVDESAGTATFTVLLDKAVNTGFTVNYGSANGSATAGSDYTAVGGSLSFAAGQTAKTITVPITNDALAEGDEYFTLSLNGLSGAGAGSVQLGDSTAQAIIVHNDQTPVATPVISVSNVVAGEGDGYVDFIVTLSGPGANEVSVNYSTSNESTNYSDFPSVSGKLVFAPGVTSQVVRVALSNDSLVETAEVFKLYLSSAVNGSINNAGGSALLIDNDTLADSSHPASLVVRGVTVDESTGMAAFVVTLDRATSDSFSVSYSTGDGSAVEGADYLATHGTLTFGPGETAKTIYVPILNDSTAEAAETFQLTLGAVNGKAAALVQVAEGTALAVIGANDQTALAKPVVSVANTVAGEGAGYIEFVVTLSAPSSSTVSVNYSSVNDTTNYSDFNSASGTLTFAPGVTTQVVRLALSEDTDVEGTEVLTLNLSSAVNATIGKPEGSGLLFDNDTLADTLHPANLSVHDVTVDESAGTVSFVVSLDKATSKAFSVDYNTGNGTARDGSDFTGVHGSLSFAAGQTAHTVTVLLNNDTAAEAVEQFYLNLGAVRGNGADQVQVAQAVGTAVIGANDQTPLATPVVSVAHVAAGEGDGYADFVITLSAPSTSQVSVSYSTSNDTTNYSDVVSTSGTLVFAAGVTTQTVRVAISDDTLAEGPEVLKLFLNSAVNATVGNGAGSLLLIDNDTFADSTNPAGLTVHNVTVDESAGTVSFVVTLDKATSDSFSVAYSTVNGSAVAGSDYGSVSGVLTFAGGDTAKTITVPLFNDSVPELDEVFSLQLGAISGKAANTVVVAQGTGTATIVHNDLPAVALPTISVSNPVVGEGDGYVDFVVSLNAPGSSQISVAYSTINTTTNYSDFPSASGTLVFAPGVTSQVVRVAITDDNLVEVAETFKLTLSSAVNATLANGSGTSGVGTIIDNDTLADAVSRASLTVQDVSVNEAAGTATFALVLSKAVGSAFNVAWNTVNGTATAGVDYAAGSGVIGFAAGDTLKLVTVNLINDPWLESSETFQLHLGTLSGSGAAHVTLGTSNATATITSDDATAPSATLALTASATTVAEGNSVSFNLASTGLAAGSQIGFVLSGADAARIAQPLTGYLTVDSSGAASVKFDVLDNGKIDAAGTLKLSLVGTPSAVSAQLALTDATVQKGTAVADKLTAAAGNAKIDGGAGLDSMTYASASTNFDIRKTADGYLVTDVTGTYGSDLLVNVERLTFADKGIALDIDGIGGQAYRLYQAAFNRAPDAGGLGYWISVLDKGMSLNDVANQFLSSGEFTSQYGANLSNAALVDKVYQNVLHRPGEALGVAYWVDFLDGHHGTQAQLVAFFSEGDENQAALIGTIGNGFSYTPYG